ncbi:MAG: hypothetical protein QOJ27_1938 [Sphingomonadales bacterium]|nr:hypothetical protein [Sphingomonadales bacterium]
MVDITPGEIAAARARARLRRATEPHAASARYDRRNDRIVVELTNGATFAFPPHLVEGLSEATADELAEVELLGGGFGLHWETLDVDYTVPGLVNGVFGTAKWMAARAGRTTSPAKAAAARVNGAKGGRPRKAG